MTPSTANVRLRPLLERQRSAWALLTLFAHIPRTEPAFRMRFNELTPEDRTFFVDFYEAPTEQWAFERICLFWNVPMDSMRKEI